MPPKPGDVYWIEDEGTGVKHIHIVLTHPEPIDGEDKVAVVNVTTVYGTRYDKTTLLRAGSHPRINHDSYVRYADADFESVAKIEGNPKYAKAVQPLIPKLFREIFDHAASGRTTSADVKTYCSRRVGGNPGEIKNLGGK